MSSIFLLLGLISISGLLYVNVYTSLVDARSWASALPESLRTAREYAAKYSPGTFFAYFGPVNHSLTLLNLIVSWEVPQARWCLLGALLLNVGTDLLTVRYFFPRNDLLFRQGDLSDVKRLKMVLGQWSRMNWVRSGLILASLLLTSSALLSWVGWPVKVI